MAATPKVDEAAPTTPACHVGDNRVFQVINETGQNGYRQNRIVLAVQDLDGETMTVGVKPEGAPHSFEDHVIGTDWSKRRLVNGSEGVTTPGR